LVLIGTIGVGIGIGIWQFIGQFGSSYRQYWYHLGHIRLYRQYRY